MIPEGYLIPDEDPSKKATIQEYIQLMDAKGLTAIPSGVTKYLMDIKQSDDFFSEFMGMLPERMQSEGPLDVYGMHDMAFCMCNILIKYRNADAQISNS